MCMMCVSAAPYQLEFDKTTDAVEGKPNRQDLKSSTNDKKDNKPMQSLGSITTVSPSSAMALPSSEVFSELRSETIGIDSAFNTPYGSRRMVYADWTASGRFNRRIENGMSRFGVYYANSHTEDDFTGGCTTRLFRAAMHTIRERVHAPHDAVVLWCGAGCTGAITKLQEIVGVRLPPATRRRLERGGAKCMERNGDYTEKPVVFIGPFEHHSNEVSWREALCSVEVIPLNKAGNVDVEYLENMVTSRKYAHRQKIASFSATSNVTGIVAPLREIAAIMHKHNGTVFFDCAAYACHFQIDMRETAPGAGDYFDGVFLAPHKLLGAPGAPGLLVFNRDIYAHDLPPTVAAGGTVDFVSRNTQLYSEDIQERETGGTPPIPGAIKAALALQLMAGVGYTSIQAREERFMSRALSRWASHPRVEILGGTEVSNRASIMSFTIKASGSVPTGAYLHHKFIAALLNDLFGIQTRAGCACAGPYGATLLGISAEEIVRFQSRVAAGFHGVKPGWTRLSFHYTADESEVDFIIDAVEFVATHGERFLPCYTFDPRSGQWKHRNAPEEPCMDIESLLTENPVAEDPPMDMDKRVKYYESTLQQARDCLDALPDIDECERVDCFRTEQFFLLLKQNLVEDCGELGACMHTLPNTLPNRILPSPQQAASNILSWTRNLARRLQGASA